MHVACLLTCIHIYSHTACMHTNTYIHAHIHTHTRPYTYSHKPQWSTPEMIEKFLNLQQAEILKRQLWYTPCCQRALRALLQKYCHQYPEGMTVKNLVQRQRSTSAYEFIGNEQDRGMYIRVCVCALVTSQKAHCFDFWDMYSFVCKFSLV